MRIMRIRSRDCIRPLARLCFAGLRNRDANGNPVPTEILCVSDIVDQASPKLLATIQQPIFRIMPGQSNSREPISHVPLLDRSTVTGESLLRFNCNGSQTVGLERDFVHDGGYSGQLAAARIAQRGKNHPTDYVSSLNTIAFARALAETAVTVAKVTLVRWEFLCWLDNMLRSIRCSG